LRRAARARSTLDAQAPDNPQNEPFLKWLGVVSNTSDAAVPKLFSTSYGEDETSVSTAYADRINIEFVKAGARGISLLYRDPRLDLTGLDLTGLDLTGLNLTWLDLARTASRCGTNDDCCLILT
jgi:uncharacterized protein YjbI with pentapeptide repeats